MTTQPNSPQEPQEPQPAVNLDNPHILIGVPLGDLMQLMGREPEKEDDTPPELRPALVCDLDGTIRYSKGGNKFVEGVQDVAVYPDVEAKLWEYRKNGFLILGVTNQAGVAFGFRTVKQVQNEINHMCENLFTRDPFHDIVGCHAHPKATDPAWRAPSLARKPHYGMLFQLERNALQHGNFWIDWPNSLMVGDRLEDRQCAERAEVPFMWAWDFFGRQPTDQQWNECVIGFKEYRKDGGFPMCPQCGEDELMSYLIADEQTHALQEYINAGMYCIKCGFAVPKRG